MSFGTYLVPSPVQARLAVAARWTERAAKQHHGRQTPARESSGVTRPVFIYRDVMCHDGGILVKAQRVLGESTTGEVLTTVLTNRGRDGTPPLPQVKTG